jgi:putative ABC transport system permease protein
VIRSQSCTAVAVTALMLAVSVTIGVQVIISSFRITVVLWLEQTLQGGIYLSAPGLSNQIKAQCNW